MFVLRIGASHKSSHDFPSLFMVMGPRKNDVVGFVTNGDRKKLPRKPTGREEEMFVTAPSSPSVREMRSVGKKEMFFFFFFSPLQFCLNQRCVIITIPSSLYFHSLGPRLRATRNTLAKKEQ